MCLERQGHLDFEHPELFAAGEDEKQDRVTRKRLSMTNDSLAQSDKAAAAEDDDIHKHTDSEATNAREKQPQPLKQKAR